MRRFYLRKIVILFMFLFLTTKVHAYVKGFEPMSLDRGLEYAVQGKFEEAKREFDDGLKKDREVYLIKEALRILGDFFDRKIAKEPAVCIFRGIDYTRKGMVDEAILDFNQALSACPDYARIYNNRGFTYYRKREFNKAKIDLNRAIELDPVYANAYYNRGITHYLNYEYKKALEDMLKAEFLGIILDPGYLDVFKKAAKESVAESPVGVRFIEPERDIPTGAINRAPTKQRKFVISQQAAKEENGK